MFHANDIDIAYPPAELEKQKHKNKRLVPSPNSKFLDVRCDGCFNITTMFSHSQTVINCESCKSTLSVPSGGKAKIKEGCAFRVKKD